MDLIKPIVDSNHEFVEFLIVDDVIPVNIEILENVAETDVVLLQHILDNTQGILGLVDLAVHFVHLSRNHVL